MMTNTLIYNSVLCILCVYTVCVASVEVECEKETRLRVLCGTVCVCVLKFYTGFSGESDPKNRLAVSPTKSLK